MLFQKPYISKSSGGACPRTPLAARALGALDCPPPPNKSSLATGLHKLHTCMHTRTRDKTNNSLQYYHMTYIGKRFFFTVQWN